MKRNQCANQKNDKGSKGIRQMNISGQPQQLRQVWQVRQECRFREKSGFGLNEVIGIAAGIIIAVVVVIPGLQGFAGDILDNLTNWWNNMASNVFATP
jgi:hypothetical protein